MSVHIHEQPANISRGSKKMSLEDAFEELGLDAEAMVRDPVGTYRGLGGPKPEVKSLEEAQSETEPMRARILESYRTLGDIVARHEATI